MLSAVDTYEKWFPRLHVGQLTSHYESQGDGPYLALSERKENTSVSVSVSVSYNCNSSTYNL